MGKLSVIFLGTNAALEVQNRVQFAWAKTEGAAVIATKMKS